MRRVPIRVLAPLMALVLFTVVQMVGMHDHAERAQQHSCLACTLGTAPAIVIPAVEVPSPPRPLFVAVGQGRQVLLSACVPAAPLGRAPPTA